MRALTFADIGRVEMADVPPVQSHCNRGGYPLSCRFRPER